MKEIRKITGKISFFIIDILVFAFEICKQIVLPGKREKGNLLSSLFIFFTGLIEKLGNFEYGIFRTADLLKLKYIKQSLLIVATFLFLVSSFEWTGEKNIYDNSSGYATEVSHTSSKTITVFNPCETTIYSNALAKSYRINQQVCLRNSIETSPAKRFLLFRNIRI